MILKGHATTGRLKWLVIGIVMIAVLPEVSSRIKNINLSPKLSACYKRFAHVTLNKVVGKYLSWFCESPLGGSKRMTSSQLTYVFDLAKRLHRQRRSKRQATKCVRKEYRVLSTQERADFHRAVIALKKNEVVKPNVYDALAMLHSELQIFKAHGGPCFLGWHRVYLLMFEMALGDEVPGVCLPYWDSSLDNELEDPAESYLFSPDLMGNGDGAIRTGPFGGWRRPPDPGNPSIRLAPVMRNVGADGELYSKESIEKIISCHDHSEIIAPKSDPENDIEVLHGGVHMFIGGEMEALETAPFDPIFFMHHAFVDYIWELFRSKLRDQLHIDPSTNYPTDHNIEFHGRDEMMDIANLTCGDGYSDELMASVEYETSPTCTPQHPTCDSPYLRCQLEKQRCIPITLRETPLPMPTFPDPVMPHPTGPVPDPIAPIPGPVVPLPDPMGPIPGPIVPIPDPVMPRPDPIIPDPMMPFPGPVMPRPDLVTARPDPIMPDPMMPFPGPVMPRPDPIAPFPDPVAPRPVPVTPVANCDHIERERHHVKPFQNNFCINGVCDVNQWVYVPVKVVTLRPPGFNQYRSFPVINGDISTANDIYQPSAYDKTNRILEGNRGQIPKGYSRCRQDGIGQIFVQSQGLNYDGHYKESALIDQRLATTMSIAYIAVKKPGMGVTQALFRAADSCGRICHTSCKNPMTGAFEPCSGALELDNRPPYMYSRNYGDATLDIWDYSTPNHCPMFEDDKFFLTFYCDYRDHLPWVEQMAAPSFMPMARPRFRPSLMVHPNECRVSKTCVIDVPCFSATRICLHDGETHKCRGSCGRYVRCNYGHYKENFCRGGTVFDARRNRCSSRPCGGARALIGGRPRARAFPNRRNPLRPSKISYMWLLKSRMSSRNGRRPF